MWPWSRWSPDIPNLPTVRVLIRVLLWNSFDLISPSVIITAVKSISAPMVCFTRVLVMADLGATNCTWPKILRPSMAVFYASMWIAARLTIFQLTTPLLMVAVAQKFMPMVFATPGDGALTRKAATYGRGM